MKPVSDLFPRLLPYVPGCPQPMAAQALVDSAITFCGLSHVIREDLEPFTTQPNVDSYYLELPDQTSLDLVMGVTVDGLLVPGLFADEVDELSRTGNPRTPGTPTTYHLARKDEMWHLVFNPAPDRAMRVVVHASLQPTRNATLLADDLVNNWADEILQGAMSRLKAIPGQAFTDLVGAQNMGASAIFAARRARLESSSMRVRGTLRARNQFFA